MAKRMSQKAFYEMAKRLIRKHGSVIIYFKDIDDGYMRRRKIRANGKSYVSHLGAMSGEWDSYHLSCFVECMGRTIPLAETFKQMESHDRGWLKPMMIEYGRNKRRIER
jgi:hypothetical protein